VILTDSLASVIMVLKYALGIMRGDPKKLDRKERINSDIKINKILE
jgi:hypothetical protein